MYVLLCQRPWRTWGCQHPLTPVSQIPIRPKLGKMVWTLKEAGEMAPRSKALVPVKDLPGFESQSTHHVSQPPVTSVPGGLMPSSDPCRL